MNKISLVVSDVDGTIVTHDKALTPRTIAAVERLHARGIAFSICSSRPPFGMRMLITWLTALLQKTLAGRADAIRSQPYYYCDVIPSGINKGRLIALLSQRLRVPREEILVLGDMENDLEMFRMAGFAVAMGNAADAVKRAAQAVTLSNDEDGVAAAIERHVLDG